MNKKLCKEMDKRGKWTKENCEDCSYTKKCKHKGVGPATGTSHGAGTQKQVRTKKISLLEDLDTQFDTDPASFKLIPAKEIFIDGQTRKHFDPAKLKELTGSIKRVGILEPLIVTTKTAAPGKAGKGQSYLLVAGERRFRAALQAGLKEVPCMIRKLSADQAVEVQVIENLQREDLNPIDEANGYKALLEKCDYDMKGIASKIGKHVSSVRKRIRLLELPKKYQKAILDEEITPGHGLVLARVQDKESREELFQEIVDDDMSVAAAEDNLKYISRRLEEVVFDKDDCAACPHNGQQQMDLYDKETTLKGRCLDSKCFDSKLNAWIAEKREALEKKGFRVITDEELRDISYGKKQELSKGEKKNLGKNYKEKCQGIAGGTKEPLCSNFVFVVRKNGKVEEYCLNPKCYQALTRKNGSGSSSSASATGRDSSNQEKIIRARKDFYIEKISGCQNKDIVARLVLLDLNASYYLGEELEDFLIKQGQYKKKGCADKVPPALEKLFNVPEKEIDAEIHRIIVDRLKDRDNNILNVLARYLKFDVAKDFVITESYLKAKTKAQIVEVAEEINLTKYLQKEKDIKQESLVNKPKGQLIALFFETGFDLAGKVPKEIVKAKDN